MTGRFSPTWLRVAGVALAVQQVALAQKCYYPNGVEAPDTEKPCSSAEGSACCPDNWQCLDNGLCYYEVTKLWGRYSCTDQKWESPGCASNLCTYDMKAPGGESITQCSNHDNKWCCNADAQNVHCCDEYPEPRPFFVLQDGKAYATIGTSTAKSNPTLASITGLANGAHDGSPSSTKAPSSSSNPTSASKNAVTSVVSTVSSGSGGLTTIVSTIVTQVPAPSSTLEPASTGEKKSKTPVIIGCAVGIPLAIILIGILFWLLRKHAHQKKKAIASSETPDPDANGSASPGFAGGARLSKRTSDAAVYMAVSTDRPEPKTDVPELEGQSLGTGRPVSRVVKGVSELDSGAEFAPGTTPHAPHLLSIGGGNGHARTPHSSWGSAPPSYSSTMNQNTWVPGHGLQPSLGGAQDAHVAAPQTSGGGYIPYRPLEQPAAVSDMAELPVNTPPAIAEMGTGAPSPPAISETDNGRRSTRISS